ncbi:hypothetical protein BGZ49_009658 [Haplosporangium sp. Z 27]|nr:hypothetical protein BGZ49_009658 [Haplosporangium sp. Z 27]
MTSSSVELAVAAFALKKGLVDVVQAAMLGAILNNLLLMMGIAFLFGGFNNHQQELKKETTQTSLPKGVTEVLEDYVRDKVDHDILTLSKIMAIFLLVLYFGCLLYQYHHREFMITPENKHNETEERKTHYWFAGLAYAVTMAAEIYSASLLVHAVEGLGRAHRLNDSFVGFILLPLVLIADLQEEVIAVRESFHNRLDKAVALMVGSCMQIALLVTPILVILGWIMGYPMTFRFSILEVVVLTASVLMINYLIADHQTNWIEGVILLAVFTFCAIAFFYDDSHVELSTGEGTVISNVTAAAADILIH